MKDLVLIKKGSFSHLTVEHFFGKEPVLTKERRHHIQETKRQRISLVIHLLQKTVESFSSEFECQIVAIDPFEEETRLCLEQHPLTWNLIDHRSVFNVFVEKNVPPCLFAVYSESFFVEVIFHLQ